MAIDLAGIFDAEYYASANPDLAVAGLTSFNQLFNHFQNYGLQEGRDFSVAIDLESYARANPDLAGAGLQTNEQLVWHLRNYGINEKRDFSPFVDLNYYSQENPDLANAGLINGEQLFWHLTNYGINEKRDFSSRVDLEFYANRYPDLAAAGLNTGEELLGHIVRYGSLEGRQLAPTPQPPSEIPRPDVPPPEQDVPPPTPDVPPPTMSFSSRSVESFDEESILARGLNTAIERLQHLAVDSGLAEDISLAFGDRLNLERAKELITQLSQGQELPQIEVLSGQEMQGLQGAFDPITNTAYISRDFLGQNIGNPDEVSRVLLEEIGHAIDVRLNSSDSPGDEGAIFSAVVRDEKLNPKILSELQIENDFSSLLINGSKVFVESSDSWTTYLWDWNYNYLGETLIPERNDSLSGINLNLGTGSIEGYSDRFVIGTWIQDEFSAGQTYSFNVRADDGFALYASSDGQNWQTITPTSNWQFAYGSPKTYQFSPTVSGEHYIWAYMFENTGDAYLDVSWRPEGYENFEARVLDLTNDFRRQNGLPPLALNNQLIAAAESHSRNMAFQDFFSHTGLDGSQVSDRARQQGYPSSFVGENIAVGYTTPEAVVQGWIDSQGHRENLLRTSYDEIGIGYHYLANDTGNVNYNHYWTQVFG